MVSIVIVGMVCMGDDVDVKMFFFNKFVLIIDVLIVSGKVGEFGMLVCLLDVIVDQVKFVIVVVCVLQGEMEEEIMINIIGVVIVEGKKIGMKVLLFVQLQFGVKLCIFGVSGYDNKVVVIELLSVV